MNTSAVQCRKYQANAIESCREQLRRGKRSPLIVAPTGSGKTTMGSEIARVHVEKGGKVLWLAHRKELIDQAADALTRNGLTVGVVAASSSKRPNPYAPVQVASVQTLLSRDQAPDATLVVFDEAHHFMAQDWGALATKYERSIRIGLTATPERQDGQGLGGLFDCIVVAASIRELTALGYLVPLEIVAPDRPLAPGKIAQRPIDAYREHCSGKLTVVFAPHVKAAREYLDQFIEAGVKATLVHGELPPMVRANALKQHNDGAVLINIAVLTEGWDNPATEACILARGCGSPGLYIQIAGRILRPHPSKSGALLIDLRGVCHLHGRPDEDRVYALDGKGIRETEEAVAGSFCKVCGAEIVPPAIMCSVCGYEKPELESPDVVNAKLHRWDFIRRDDDAVRKDRATKWIAMAVASGKSPWMVRHKYKAVYGEEPAWLKSMIATAGRARVA